MKSCGTCTYGEVMVGDDDEPRIDCRRYPPTVTDDGEGLVTVWAQVIADDWCGEWSAGAATVDETKWPYVSP